MKKMKEDVLNDAKKGGGDTTNSSNETTSPTNNSSNEVSPVHKITFSEEFNSSLIIKSSSRPYRYTGCPKKSRSNGIANLLSNVFFIAFSLVVTASAVPSDFMHPLAPLNH